MLMLEAQKQRRKLANPWNLRHSPSKNGIQHVLQLELKKGSMGAKSLSLKQLTTIIASISKSSLEGLS